MKLEAIEEKGKKPVVSLEIQQRKFEEKTGQSFPTFYKKFFPKLSYYLTGYCKDMDLATDMTCEAFIKGLEEIEKYNPERAGFSTWLFTIARNLTLQEMKKRNKFTSIDQKIDEEGSSIKDFLNDSSEEDIRMDEINELSKKKGSLMRDAIKLLKNPYRNVIEMREMKNMSYKEIATKLGTNEDISIIVKDNTATLPFEIASINELVDINGKPAAATKLIEGDKNKTPFFTEISMSDGEYFMNVRRPQNLSTLKSQIRNGRKMLQKMVEKDFNILDGMYL